jgi:integrase
VGKPVRQSVFEACWRKAAKRAGLAGVRFHDLRHTYVSLLARDGWSQRVVQERIGHEHASSVTDLYSHLFEDDRENAGRGAIDRGFAEKCAQCAREISVGTASDSNSNRRAELP